MKIKHTQLLVDRGQPTYGIIPLTNSKMIGNGYSNGKQHRQAGSGCRGFLQIVNVEAPLK